MTRFDHRASGGITRRVMESRMPSATAAINRRSWCVRGLLLEGSTGRCRGADAIGIMVTVETTRMEHTSRHRFPRLAGLTLSAFIERLAELRALPHRFADEPTFGDA